MTCVSSTRDQVEAMVSDLQAAGISNILALRGDRVPEAEPSKDFMHATDLIAYIKQQGDFDIAAACYPEGHVECPRREKDIDFLKAKVDCGVDFLTTQMFFDNNVYFRYLARLRNAGITIPVIAGIMPVTNGSQISRICKLSGTVLPPRFRAIVDRFGDDPSAMLSAGVAYATEQIIDLFADGVNAVHVYTMNKPEVAKRIMANLKGIVNV